jgi:tetratricopeptide (TPR) repeat protein
MDAVATLPAVEAPYAQYYRFAKRSGTLDTFTAVLASQLIHADAAPGRERAREWLDRSLGEGTVSTESAWRVMLAAAEYSPGDASLWVALARETRTRDQRQAFSDAVLALMDTTPSMPLAARVLAMSWSSERGALAGASKALIDALEAAPTPIPKPVQEELSQLADLLEVQVREAEVDAPGAAVAAINLSRLRTKLGDPERGVLVLGERYGRMALPEQMLAIPHYAEALLAAQRYQEAEGAVRDLAALAPTKAELRVLLARLLARVGKAREAFAEYDVLLSIPDLDAATRTLLESEQAALDIPND